MKATKQTTLILISLVLLSCFVNLYLYARCVDEVQEKLYIYKLFEKFSVH